MTAKEAVNWIINIMADIGKAEHRDLWHYEQALSEIKEMLESQPERKKGRWLMNGERYGHMYWRCSQCGEEVDYIGANFCHNCGSYNGGEQDE